MSATIRSPLSTTERAGRRTLAFLGTLLFIVVSIYASRAPIAPAITMGGADKPSTLTSGAVAAAEAFLGSLDAKQKEKAEFAFGSEKKSNWSNLPVTIVPRNGVRLGDLTMAQRALAMAAVAAVLSKDGYQKIVDIMDGDQQLAANQNREGRGGRAMFGSDQYFLAFFGKPSATHPWMVQFGGHHLGLNVTVIGNNFVLTPTHTGAQPALFKRDGKEVRPLGLEIDNASKLVNALDEKQRSQAVISDRPQSELLLGPGRDNRKPPEFQGIKGSSLTAEQQAMLLDVISAWVKIVDGDTVTARLAETKGKIGETYFAWKGPTAKGSAAYFRVQGPTIVIEYAPQGGTDHIHTVVRNPNDDYGAGILKQ
jgi:hypothetical protein